MTLGSIVILMKTMTSHCQGWVDPQDQSTTLGGKGTLTLDMTRGEDLHPEMIIELDKERADMRTEAKAEREGELEQLEPRSLVMENQEDPEGVARRPNVWWGLQ